MSCWTPNVLVSVLSGPMKPNANKMISAWNIFSLPATSCIIHRPLISCKKEINTRHIFIHVMKYYVTYSSTSWNITSHIHHVMKYYVTYSSRHEILRHIFITSWNITSHIHPRYYDIHVIKINLIVFKSSAIKVSAIKTIKCAAYIYSGGDVCGAQKTFTVIVQL